MAKEYLTSDSSMAAIAAGVAWGKAITGSAAANGSGDNVFRTGTGTTVFEQLSAVTSGPLFTTYLYEASGASGITSTSGFNASAAGVNRNRNSGATSNVMWLTSSGAVLTTSATLISTRFIGGGTGVGGTSTGGGSDAACAVILKPSTVYNLKWKSGSADNQFLIRTMSYDV